MKMKYFKACGKLKTGLVRCTGVFRCKYVLDLFFSIQKETWM